jgi:uncharacterized protein
MSRPKRIRKVSNPPLFKGFMPIGTAKQGKPVVIDYEEYEAIRLCDMVLLGQNEAALSMGISRPTFTRIYERARRKIAQAFMQACPIVFEGGKVYFDSEWYTCKDCGSWFNHPAKNSEITACALCGSGNISQYNNEQEILRDNKKYFCPACETDKHILQSNEHEIIVCPDCTGPLTRKWSPAELSNKN